MEVYMGHLCINGGFSGKPFHIKLVKGWDAGMPILWIGKAVTRKDPGYRKLKESWYPLII